METISKSFLAFQTFWGPGSEFTLDSSRDVQVVTQFFTSDGTDTGELVEVRRKWVQGRTCSSVEFG